LSRPAGIRGRLLWFIALYVGGVVAVAAVALLVRLALRG
jgi:hypothetical protein